MSIIYGNMVGGASGTDGKSAYQYAVEGGYTGTEAEFAAKLAEEYPDGIVEATGGTVTEGNLVVWDVDRSLVRDGGAVPTKLPNPNALTFTGAVTGSYDGSQPLTVEIPSGGGGDAEEYPDGIVEATGGTVTEGNLVVWDVDRSLVRDGGAVPTKLPNPNALTFTGAVTGSYDGSQPLTVEIPSGGGGGLSAFEKIGTIDLSTMADGNLGVEFTVTDVTEIVLIWTGMTNTTTSNSSIRLAFNSSDYYLTLGPRTGKAGSPLNGYTYLKVLENVGILPIVSAGAISNTNYAIGGDPCSYNLIPVKEKIQTFEIRQPPTQYYADAGIVEVYVR